MRAVELPEKTALTPAVLFQATVVGRERVVMGTIDGEVIAVAKLAFEEGVLVLRGVQIAEPWRRRGIGARLLTAVTAASSEASYVIAYAHLERFYATHGWRRVHDGVPAFLVERCAKYRSKGDDVFVALRPAVD